MPATRDNRRFKGGSGSYVCGVCKRQTRETGEGESDLKQCAFCFLEGMLENSLSDGAIEEDEFNTELAELKRRYNR